MAQLTYVLFDPQNSWILNAISRATAQLLCNTIPPDTNVFAAKLTSSEYVLHVKKGSSRLGCHFMQLCTLAAAKCLPDLPRDAITHVGLLARLQWTKTSKTLTLMPDIASGLPSCRLEAFKSDAKILPYDCPSKLSCKHQTYGSWKSNVDAPVCTCFSAVDSIQDQSKRCSIEYEALG